MPYQLGARSLQELQGVHPALVSVVQRAILITTQDFTVYDGLRTLAEQEENVRRGVSQTMNSKHLPQADGYGHAVDLVPIINGQPRWEWPPIFQIACVMAQVSREARVRLRWGGCWDQPLDALGTDPTAMQAAVSAYCARHPGPDFIDGPHYELL
jgi:peptidoglycan L-alanyl-D-glutamate endopeptidase CwlK